MEVSNFNEKLNKLDGKIYTIEEVVCPIDGIYEGELIHDNVNLKTLNVYTGSKLTGDKINSYSTSTPSLTPWKTVIKIFSNKIPLYISYETTGDQVEAEDINKLQNSVVDTQENLNNEIERATTRENNIEKNLNAEINRAKNAESTIINNLNKEIDRSKIREDGIDKNINDYKTSNDSEIQKLKEKDTDLQNKKSDKTYVDIELNKRYLKNEVFTKDEVLQRIKDVIGSAPEALDTLSEIATALNNDANFAGTMTKQLSGKVDKVSGKQLSDENYTKAEKNKLAGIESNANNYSHPSTHSANMITDLSIVAKTGDYNDLKNKPNNNFDGNINKTISYDDFDNIINPGLYTVKSCKHSPNTIISYWSLIVLNSYDNNYVHQIAIEHGAKNIYIRYKQSTWSEWTKMPIISDIPTRLSQLENDIGLSGTTKFTWNDLKGV